MRHTWSEWSLITAAVICRVRLSSGDRSLPRACTLVSSWVQEGSVEGSSAAPVRRLTGQDAESFNPWKRRGPKEDEAAGEAAAPCAPDLRGERVWPPDSALDPSFQNTAPPSQPSQHDEDTRSPVCFGHFIPFGHFILIFYFNILSFAPPATISKHYFCICNCRLNAFMSCIKQCVNTSKCLFRWSLCFLCIAKMDFVDIDLICLVTA